MGGFQAKPFVPNEEIVGQGKSVLKLAKRLFISKYELDRLYHEFMKHEDPHEHLITIADMFKTLKVPYNFFLQVYYQLYDLKKTGNINFQEFVVATWGFLSLNADGIASLCFTLFDIERYLALDVCEVKYLINVIWEFKPTKAVTKAMEKLDKNQDSIVTVEEFRVLCRHHPNIITPLKDCQNLLRKRTVYSRFWKELMVRRLAHFGLKSIVQLRALDGVDVVLLALEYLNLRKDIVPNHFVEQWRHTQRRKAQSSKGNVELPFELREKIVKEMGEQMVELWRNQNDFGSSVDLDESTFVI